MLVKNQNVYLALHWPEAVPGLYFYTDALGESYGMNQILKTAKTRFLWNESKSANSENLIFYGMNHNFVKYFME